MDWFKTIGINSKQQKLYIFLIEHGASTATELAKSLGEQRTNIYILAEELEKRGLLERDESQSITRFRATSPSHLQQLMNKCQQNLAHESSALKQALPELLSTFQLTNPRPGFTYFEGLKGYSAVLDDMTRSQSEICVFGASNTPTDRHDAWTILQNKLAKRALAKINTRLIFENNLKSHIDTSLYTKHCMDVRFWGNAIFDGEIAIYEQKVVLTTYDDNLINFVMKNHIIADTLRSIFDTAWDSATE